MEAATAKPHARNFRAAPDASSKTRRDVFWVAGSAKSPLHLSNAKPPTVNGVLQRLATVTPWTPTTLLEVGVVAKSRAKTRKSRISFETTQMEHGLELWVLVARLCTMTIISTRTSTTFAKCRSNWRSGRPHRARICARLDSANSRRLGWTRTTGRTTS